METYKNSPIKDDDIFSSNFSSGLLDYSFYVHEFSLGNFSHLEKFATSLTDYSSISVIANSSILDNLITYVINSAIFIPNISELLEQKPPRELLPKNFQVIYALHSIYILLSHRFYYSPEFGMSLLKLSIKAEKSISRLALMNISFLLKNGSISIIQNLCEMSLLKLLQTLITKPDSEDQRLCVLECITSLLEKDYRIFPPEINEALRNIFEIVLNFDKIIDENFHRKRLSLILASIKVSEKHLEIAIKSNIINQVIDIMKRKTTLETSKVAFDIIEVFLQTGIPQYIEFIPLERYMECAWVLLEDQKRSEVGCNLILLLMKSRPTIFDIFNHDPSIFGTLREICDNGKFSTKLAVISIFGLTMEKGPIEFHEILENENIIYFLIEEIGSLSSSDTNISITILNGFIRYLNSDVLQQNIYMNEMEEMINELNESENTVILSLAQQISKFLKNCKEQ